MPKKRDKTVPEQIHHAVIMVTRPELKSMVESMKLHYAASLDEALERAHTWGKKSLTVIPNGISVIVE